MDALEFAEWVAREIFDEMWECNKNAFPELACRRLEKLGIVELKDGFWIKRKEKSRNDKRRINRQT